MFNCIFILLFTVVQIFATTDECFLDFCNNTQNYPYDKIQALLKQNNNYINFFGTTLEKETYIRKRKDVENNCTVTKIGLYPKQGRNIKGKKSTIVNTGEYQQYIRYEQCLDPYCEPKVKVIKLAVFDDVTNTIYADKFVVPTTCYIKGNNFSVS